MQSLVPVHSAVLPNHMLVDRQRSIVGVGLVALRIRRTLQQPQESGFVPASHLKVYPSAPSRSSTTAIHTHKSLRFSAFLAPKYVHISSSAIAPLFDPTTHRCSACAHYSRRRRYSRAFNTHLNRPPLDLFREARLLGFRRVLPLAIAALVNLPTACVRLWASNWSNSVCI